MAVRTIFVTFMLRDSLYGVVDSVCGCFLINSVLLKTDEDDNINCLHYTNFDAGKLLAEGVGDAQNKM